MHVDTFIDDCYGEHKYARWFLFLSRLPAVLRADFEEQIKQYKLFCTWGGERYRCTGASRLGDVWLTKDFNQDIGYQRRINVKDCSEWSKTPEGGDAKTFTQGWRHFHCAGCEYQWREPCRDHASPSGVCCPKCSVMTTPHQGEEDLTLPIDKSGNLV